MIIGGYIIKGSLFYTVFLTEKGWVGILASSRGLLGTTLPQRTRQRTLISLEERVEQALESFDVFTGITKRFQAYYSGEKVVFPDKLDFSFATPFQRQVWEATRLIPYGETRSYGWVAKQIGKPLAARAVGQAVGKNPFYIVVPCHRVIASDGTLGGFGGDLALKRSLLKLEKNKRF